MIGLSTIVNSHKNKECYFFIEFEKFQYSHEITIANGKVIPSIGKGTIKVVPFMYGEKHVKELGNIWYVPNISIICFLLLQLRISYKEASTFISTNKECLLKIDEQVVSCGTRNKGRGLYKADLRNLAQEH